MAPRKRGSTSKKEPSTQVLPGRLEQDEKRALAQGVISRYGGRQSKDAGIDLEEGGDDALEQWFLLSLLFSRGISAGQIMNTFKVLCEGGVRNVADAGKLEYQELWDKLSEGKAQRRDRTTKQIQSVNQVLQEKYGGSIAKLLASSQDPHEMRANVEALPYFGPTTAEIFLRDLRELYPQVKEVLDISDRALEAGQHLGVFSKVGRASKRQKGGDQEAGQPTKAVALLEEIANDANVDVRDYETALIKLHNAHYRGYAKCPGGANCAATQSDGGAKKEQDKEDAPAGDEQKEPADVSMGEAAEETPADVSKDAPKEETDAQNAAIEKSMEKEMTTAEADKATPADVSKDAPKEDVDAQNAAIEKSMEKEVTKAEADQKKPSDVSKDAPQEEIEAQNAAIEKSMEKEVTTAEASKETPADVSKDAPKEEVDAQNAAIEKGMEKEVAAKGDQKTGASEPQVAGKENGVDEADVPRLEDAGTKKKTQTAEGASELKAGG